MNKTLKTYEQCKKTGLTMFLIVVCVFILHGQDLHFTQSFRNPMFLNPALTSCSRCNGMAGLIYRNQWAGINMPVKTYSAFVESKIQPDFMRRDHFAIGGFVFSDLAGDGDLKTTAFTVNAALKKFLGWGRDTVFVSLGFGVGAGQRSINFENLTFSSQWNGVSINPALPADLSNYNDRVNYFDFNAGINFYYAPYQSNYHWDAGISLMHINQADIAFAKANDATDRLPVKITAHSRFTTAIHEHISLTAGAMFANQGSHDEILIGLDVSQCLTLSENAELKLGSNKSSPVVLLYGLWFRMGPLRDISPQFGLGLFGYNLMLSYDIPFFNNVHVNNYKGSFEISLSKNIDCRRKRRCDCMNYGF